jgi:hypothetical protein
MCVSGPGLMQVLAPGNGLTIDDDTLAGQRNHKRGSSTGFRFYPDSAPVPEHGTFAGGQSQADSFML